MFLYSIRRKDRLPPSQMDIQRIRCGTRRYVYTHAYTVTHKQNAKTHIETDTPTQGEIYRNTDVGIETQIYTRVQTTDTVTETQEQMQVQTQVHIQVQIQVKMQEQTQTPRETDRKSVSV